MVELKLGRTPVYFSPSSPGANITTEQNPSLEVISNVSPSGDLFIISEGTTSRRRNIPGKIGKRSIVKIANNADWSLLLGIVDENRVLRSHSVNYAIWERKRRTCRVGSGIS